MLWTVSIKFLFSTKGFIYISMIISLIWLLKEYPEWRQGKRAALSAASTHPTPLREHEKQKDCNDTATVDTQDINKATKKATHSFPSKNTLEKVSLTHYMLVTPFAALYIVGRAIVDTIRYSLYYLIWACERALPRLDDWLFEFVTVAIPKALASTKSWWTEQGRPAWTRCYAYAQQRIVPSTVHSIEVIFVGCYNGICAMQRVTMEFMTAWRRFVDRHDWHQLFMDLSDIAHKTCWIPAAWITARVIILCRIIWVGARAMAISIAEDIKWVCLVAIPVVYGYAASTRFAQVGYRGLAAAAEGARWGFVCVNDYLLAPTIGRFLTFFIRSIDSLILLLQQRTIHETMARPYRLVAPHIVWMLADCVVIINSLHVAGCLVYSELLQPACKLFMEHVMPHLTIVYTTAATSLAKWYNVHFYPAWLAIYPYLNAPLLWMHTNLTLPVCRQAYHVVASMINYITQHLSAQLWNLCAKITVITSAYAQSVYSFIQLCLLKQAPALTSLVQSFYETVIQVCDWNALHQEIGATVSFAYNWVSNQANLAYSSLERSLNNWADEQQSYVPDVLVHVYRQCDEE
ncbi:hypothetical protein [Parasitella parasitica]|uniref:Uncharacterized protein n=1 Tax=Parasitella parasitica TaxID=35722 RepID=A0A0B7N2L1_9FUNG|nr:hypothetical protein [Parasitella parasitica]